MEKSRKYPFGIESTLSLYSVGDILISPDAPKQRIVYILQKISETVKSSKRKNTAVKNALNKFYKCIEKAN